MKIKNAKSKISNVNMRILADHYMKNEKVRYNER